MSSVLPDIKFNLSLVISNQDGIMNKFQIYKNFKGRAIARRKDIIFVSTDLHSKR